MKRLGWGILAFTFSIFLTLPVSALDTIPTTPNKTTGPLLIAGYYFSGPNLRYVQVFNSSSNLASLDGWQLASTSKSAPVATTVHTALHGMLEPGKHVIAAIPGLFDRTTFSLPVAQPVSSPLVGAVSLIPPAGSGFSDESVAVPTISVSTFKETEGTFLNYYARREVSATTGNYLSGFTMVLPTEKLKNDALYLAPNTSVLQVVELFPDAPSCSPFDVSMKCTDYVKLYNPSTTPIDLTHYRIRTGGYGQAPSSSNTRAMTGVLESMHYGVFPLSLSSTGSWVWLEDTYGVARYEQTSVQFPSSSGHSSEAWSYDALSGAWKWTNLPSPSDTPNTFPEPIQVNRCDGIRLNEIAANVTSEDQFIEIHNANDEVIDLEGCALQTNRSNTTSFVFGNEALAPNEVKAIYVKDTDLTLTKTTTGSVYLLSSDFLNEIDSVEYDELGETTSWAFVSGAWNQTYVITPNATNVWMQYLECETGYVRSTETGNCNKITTADMELSDCGPGKYRSPDTNRCRSLETLAAALTPCDTGQYRNLDTNRCRSLASTASVLVPCAANQERNVDTNRCRSIVSDSELKPCAANQERNPDTNRCRNATGATTADFPVEVVASSGEATMGWWAFGGVGTLAAGYAGWEWRREVMSWIKKVLPFGIGRS